MWIDFSLTEPLPSRYNLTINMQTFLAYPSFEESAKVLDRLRLGKERLEVWQILRTLTGESRAWLNHPAVLMWIGYEDALRSYGVFVCNEWTDRGYKDTMFQRFWNGLDPLGMDDIVMPHWLGDERLHSSHRASLLAKNPEHYSQFGWTDDPAPFVEAIKSGDKLPYHWPI